MKILVVTCSPWRDDNNIGNSYSNLYSDMKDVEVASLYLKNGIPDNNVVKQYFQINEKSLIKNIFNSKLPSGRELNINKNFESSSQQQKEKTVYNKLRILRWQIFFWVREIIWKIGRWKSPELRSFIDEYQPDIIFAPLQDTMYLNNILLYIKKHTKVPMVTYAWDDVYSLKQFSYSPLYWINRFMQRAKIRQVVNKCEYLYVISKSQKIEYENLLNKECKLLNKGYNFNLKKPLQVEQNKPLKLLYTGNISSGRWKVLVEVGLQLKEINKNKMTMQLFIYTLSPITKKMRKALNIPNSVILMKAVSSQKIKKIQENSDILLHVEPLSLKEMLVSRLSFSTKLVDYFYKSKCIFAVGKKESASIKYLMENDAAVIASNSNEIKEKLMLLIKKPDMLKEYAEKAWECGKQNHQIDVIQKKLYNELKNLTKDNFNENNSN